jgi:hypothetical protein
VQHLFIGCAVVSIIWSSTLIWANLQEVIPSMDLTMDEWWASARSRLQRDKRKALNTLVILVVWSIWKERNRRVFDGIFTPIQRIIDQIKTDARFWVVASYGRLRIPYATG